jgi:origin recognition complex subunit 5
MAPLQELLDDLNDRFPCRSRQIQALSTLFAEGFPTPPSLVIHGLEATGKSSITESILETLDVPHAIINSRECITGRHLLEQTTLTCRDVIGKRSGSDSKPVAQVRCDSLNGLVNQLEKILHGQPRLILVFDGIDRQREAPPTLMTALARFGSIVSVREAGLEMGLTVAYRFLT